MWLTATMRALSGCAEGPGSWGHADRGARHSQVVKDLEDGDGDPLKIERAGASQKSHAAPARGDRPAGRRGACRVSEGCQQGIPPAARTQSHTGHAKALLDAQSRHLYRSPAPKPAHSPKAKTLAS